jgi:hypothetical protein
MYSPLLRRSFFSPSASFQMTHSRDAAEAAAAAVAFMVAAVAVVVFMVACMQVEDVAISRAARVQATRSLVAPADRAAPLQVVQAVQVAR